MHGVWAAVPAASRQGRTGVEQAMGQERGSGGVAGYGTGVRAESLAAPELPGQTDYGHQLAAGG